MQGAPSGDGATHTLAPVSSTRAWGAVGVLTAIYAFSCMDRLVLSMVIGPIKHDLQIGDFQAGLLLGVAFAITYVLFGIPFGVLVDRMSRRLVLLTGLLIWTAATLGSAFATTFFALFVLRMFVGMGEASCSPAAHSVISDIFPRERRGAPLSLYQLGSAAGSGLSLTVGGALLAWYASQSNGVTIFGHAISNWQLVFLAVGAPGILLAFLVPIVPEPRRGVALAPTANRVDVRAFTKAHAAILSLVLAVFACSVIVSYAQTSWTVEFLRRTFHWDPGRIGATLGPIHLIFPVASHAITGFLVDRIAARGVKDAPLRFFLYMAIAALPFAALQYLATSPVVFIVSHAAMSFLYTPTIAFGAMALQQFTPTELRGRVSAVFLSFISLMGSTIGPAVIGALTEFGFKDESKLGLALAIVVTTGVVLSIVFLALALRPLRAAVVAAEAREAAAASAAA